MTGTATEIISRVPITTVWRSLGCGPLVRGRGRAFWRDGDGLNVSVSDRKGCWYDFVAGTGGGVIDLVVYVKGGTRAEALAFVADLAGVKLETGKLTRREKRDYARQREQAQDLAQKCAWWAEAYACELARIKAVAYGDGDIDALAWSARELYLLQRAIPAAVLDKFLQARAEKPDETAALIKAGRADEAQAYMIAAALVIALEQAQERDRKPEAKSAA